MHCTSSTILFAFSLIACVIAQNDFQSPCPRVFLYETGSTELDRWYGNVTMLSKLDSHGVWLRMYFDRPSLQLGNWYGEVSSSDNTAYLIENVEDQLKANVSKTIRFFVKYDVSEPPPKLLSISLNARQICPEKERAETSTVPLELKTSSPVNTKPRPPPLLFEDTINKPVEGDSQKPASGDDEFYKGDLFPLFNRSPEQNASDDSSFNDICGTVAVRPNQLIDYDNSTYEGDFPWHVALYHSKGIDLTYICGASLISKTFVITVAHCAAKPGSSTPLNPDYLIAYLGKHYLKRFSNKGIQDKQISEIIIHPEYQSDKKSNDIALLKLALPVDFSDYVRPVCLWQEPADLNRIVNKQGTVVGWGADKTGQVADQLKQSEMTVVSQDTCLFSNPEFYSRFTSENTFCAGFKNGASECNGDSGGGIVFPKENSLPRRLIWQLRGLVTIGAALHDRFKCDPSHYVVFTDITRYSDWIKNKIN